MTHLRSKASKGMLTEIHKNRHTTEGMIDNRLARVTTEFQNYLPTYVSYDFQNLPQNCLDPLITFLNKLETLTAQRKN